MVNDVMDTKVLLRLIKDDIKILENINDSFINQTNLTLEEAEVAIARARALVMEFEVLSKNLAKEEGPKLSDEVGIEKEEDKSERKVRSLRNFLPFVKTEEKPAQPVTDHLESEKQEPASSVEDIPSFEQSHDLGENTTGNGLSPDSAHTFIAVEKDENLIDSALFQLDESINEEEGQIKTISAPVIESPVEVIPAEKPEVEILSEKSDEEKKTPGGIPEEKHRNINDLLSHDRTEMKFETKPLKSIRDGIGINDRFLFIRELFHNNLEKYDQTLTALDGLTGIEDAVKFLKQNFKWSKSEAAEKFLQLIKRRFTK